MLLPRDARDQSVRGLDFSTSLVTPACTTLDKVGDGLDLPIRAAGSSRGHAGRLRIGQEPGRQRDECERLTRAFAVALNDAKIIEYVR